MDSGLKTLSPASQRNPTNPWSMSPPVAVCSLSVVMDEELAKHIQREEENKLAKTQLDDHVSSPAPPSNPADTSSDHLLAEMLQLEYDKEHDRQLNCEENHYNKHNKGW